MNKLGKRVKLILQAITRVNLLLILIIITTFIITQNKLNFIVEKSENLNQRIKLINQSIDIIEDGGISTQNEVKTIITGIGFLENSLSNLDKKNNRFIYNVENGIDEIEQKIAGLSDLNNSELAVESPIYDTPLNFQIDENGILTKSDSEKNNALRVIEQNPNNREALKTLGRISYEQGDLYSAKQYYEKIIEIEPSDLISFHTLGRISIQNKEYKESVYFYSRLNELQPEDAGIYYNLSFGQYNLGLYNKAYDSIRKAISIDSNSTRSLTLAGEISDALGNSLDAISYIEQAISINPNSFLYSYLGTIYWKQNLKIEALENWEKTIGLLDVNFEKDYLEILNTYEKMANCAYELGLEMKIEDFYTQIIALGGNELVHFIYMKSLKSRGKVSDLLDVIDEFEEVYPLSSYVLEVSDLKVWADGV